MKRKTEVTPGKAKSKRAHYIRKNNAFFNSYIGAVKSLNKTYYVTKLSKALMVQMREEMKQKSSPKIQIDLPTILGAEFQKEQKKGDVTDLLKSAIRYDIYANSLVSAVTVTEHFLEAITEYILLKHPQKILVTKKGQPVESKERSIPIKTLLNANNLEDLIAEEVKAKLLNLLYAKPADYFEYLDNALGLKYDDDTKKTYIEIKATRDLIIHSGGKVNEIYIQKSGSKCRVTDTRQNISVDDEYLINAFATMKQIIKKTYIDASKIYLKITDKRELFP